jgi:hypothetical protein
VRRQPQQGPVLSAGGLTLGAVGDDYGGEAALARGVQDGGELTVHGEARAAAASEAGRLDVGDERAGGPAVRDAAVSRQVGVHVLGLASSGQNPGQRRGRTGGHRGGHLGPAGVRP